MMKAEDWASEFLQLGFFLAISIFFVVYSGRDTYQLVRHGVTKQGLVTTVRKQDPDCYFRCPYQSWVLFDDNTRTIAKFRLNEGEKYTFTLLPKNSDTISAETWNPFGNKALGTGIGVLFFFVFIKRILSFGHVKT